MYLFSRHNFKTKEAARAEKIVSSKTAPCRTL
jgi:hypothetical protein